MNRGTLPNMPDNLLKVINIAQNRTLTITSGVLTSLLNTINTVLVFALSDSFSKPVLAFEIDWVDPITLHTGSYRQTYHNSTRPDTPGTPSTSA